MPEGEPEVVTGEDTAAFQRFYAGDQPVSRRGILYRLLIGWWRDRS